MLCLLSVATIAALVLVVSTRAFLNIVPLSDVSSQPANGPEKDDHLQKAMSKHIQKSICAALAVEIRKQSRRLSKKTLLILWSMYESLLADQDWKVWLFRPLSPEEIEGFVHDMLWLDEVGSAFAQLEGEGLRGFRAYREALDTARVEVPQFSYRTHLRREMSPENITKKDIHLQA